MLKTYLRKILGEVLLGMLEYYRSRHSKTFWGGPFNAQIFRQRIFLDLIRTIKFSAIVETGTSHGATTAFLCEASNLPVYTVEANPRSYGFSRSRFFTNNKVKVYRGDSREFLRKFSKNPKFTQRQIFFYLDAHWDKNLPLREELQIIFTNWYNAAVMIDDFQVPGDEGYGYDVYEDGVALQLDYLDPISDLGLHKFFPAKNSKSETGMKRGCILLARAPDIIQQLMRLDTLVPHAD
jgi:hypothetical protein